MHYLFVYHGGVVPEDQAEQNISDLWNWLDNLKARGYEKVRFAGFGRKTVSPHAVEDYQGDIFGVSVMEAESLEEAVSLTTDWPELQYGGKIEVFEALAADYPRSSSDAHILNLFADVRRQILDTLHGLPADKLDHIPPGFRNNMRWQAGHVLTVTDELIFQFSGAGSRIPTEYKTWFASGTDPSGWSDAPPEIDVLLRRLEGQMAEIGDAFEGRLTHPVADQSNFLQAKTVCELFHVLIAHESLHLGMIQAMAKNFVKKQAADEQEGGAHHSGHIDARPGDVAEK